MRGITMRRKLHHAMIAAAVFVCFLIIPHSAFSGQAQPTLSGAVRNSETGEALISAQIVVKELQGTGALSNAYGFYSLTLPSGRYTISVRFLGFRTLTDTIALDSSMTRNFNLVPEPIRIGEVVVSGARANTNVTSTELSARTLEVKGLESVPVLLGERDVLKTIQLLPGIKSAGEGSTGFYARGGSVDQNLIILDEAPVYNSSHLLGFLSVFNSDAVKDVKVMTGDMPAEYGGRLSSVVDIRTNEGNTKNFSGTGGIGLLDSRLTIEGPIVKDEGSFIISGRRTYADLFFNLSKDTTVQKTSLYFYDLNLKANIAAGNRDRFFLSGYFGRDNFDYPDIVGFNWGNATATLRWNHLFSGKLFSNTSFIFSDYQYTNVLGAGASQYEIQSGIRDLNFKTDLQYSASSGSTLKFGANAVYHTFIPGTIVAGPASPANDLVLQHQHALEYAAYASHELALSPAFRVNYGLRLSIFDLIGPSDVYTYDDNGDIAATQHFDPGALIQHYSNLEPRIALTIQLDGTSSLKSSYARTAQYLHLLSNSTSANPGDLWVPSTNNVPPQTADQVSVGYFKNYGGDTYETSLQLYYKSMHSLIDYKNGADLQLNPTMESLLLFGRGWSYGAELLIRKHAGAFTGWIGYTLSRTREQFAEVNRGEAFPARQDQTHTISVVAMLDAGEHWSFGTTWVYYTGNAVTFPEGNYMISGRLVPFFTARNGYRMPDYHRLDLSVTYKFSEHSQLNLSLYNVYDRANAYSIFFRRDPDDDTKTQAVQLTLFPIIPSLTYNFSF